jgi:iron complex transport system substrate-binding protein
VIAAKPDVIVDYGAINDTYVSLADRVQQQTGIPYLLLDGAFDRIPASLRTIGALAGDEARGEDLARYARDTVDDVTRRVARVPADEAPAPVLRARPARPRHRPRRLDQHGSDRPHGRDRTSRRRWAAAGSCRCRSSRCSRGIPMSSSRPTRRGSRRCAAIPCGARSPPSRRGRVHLAPAEPFGWIDFPPSINRLVGPALARPHPLS